MSNQWDFCTAFHVKVGYGIHDIAMVCGIMPVTITGRVSEIVLKRSAGLGIGEVHQGVRDKVQIDVAVINQRSV